MKLHFYRKRTLFRISGRGTVVWEAVLLFYPESWICTYPKFEFQISLNSISESIRLAMSQFQHLEERLLSKKRKQTTVIRRSFCSAGKILRYVALHTVFLHDRSCIM